MAKRRPLSTRTRFEVFKRDGFLCQYCGSHPPDVVLWVDHIMPVSKGGDSDFSNLVTACERCNRGKSNVLLSSVPVSLADQAALVAEREKQLRGYYEIVQQQRERIESEVWDVIEVFTGQRETFHRDWYLTIKRFIEKLGKYPVIDAMEIARSKRFSGQNRCFRYFCGICWRWVTEKEVDAANG